jgi:ferric-dicitrate binding protein FerR (iron transport regulator)
VNKPPINDSVWNAAWDWVVLGHEQALDEAAHAALAAWLATDAAHRAAYEEALDVWLAAAFAPPSEEPDL